MRLAFIGIGGQGASNLRSLVGHTFVAFADVDDVMAAPVYKDFPAVPRYRDFRRMLDRHRHEIDGVLVCTPDHSHYPIAMTVMQAGLNVFVEKPLATTIWECRQLEAAARLYGVKTQLGIQGHNAGALRILREWLDAGAIGPVRAVHLWTDRMQPERYTSADALAPAEAVPSTLDWDLWQCARPERDFSPLYVPNRWRNWWHYGTGPIGDIGLHMFDVLEFALELGFPDLVEAETPWRNAFTAPPWTRARWDFPARGVRPPVVVHWYNGTRDGAFVRPRSVPHLPPEIIATKSNGMAFVGDDATAFIPDMRASSAPRIYPSTREAEVLANRPSPTLPRPKGSHFENWFRAIRDGGEASAHFGYGAPLTEMVLLGQLAQRTGQPIRWDRAAMRTLGTPEADALVRPPLRDGWDFSA
ncbi:MAG: Gfo/Idh/MocA family oxidoreductase [Burkholderiales bacterium]|nr:Gfo/Idh/MocA family oxidoreductase [Opitutaceae bacterium]